MLNLKMWYKFIARNSGLEMQDTDNNNNNLNQFGDEYDAIKISFSLHNKLQHRTLITIHIPKFIQPHWIVFEFWGSSIDG